MTGPFSLPRVPRRSGHAAAPADAMPPDRDAPAPGVEEHRFPCDTCGADMRFDPASQGMLCDQCGNAEPIPAPSRQAVARALAEVDLRRSLAGLPEEATETTHVTQCPNCGARFELDPDVTAAECPFCATPVVAGTGTDRHIRPAAVLPFAVTEAQGREALRGWLGSLWFAPNALKRYASANRRMAGIYAPHWTFDAETMTQYTGARGIHRTESYTNSKGETVTRTTTDWYPASGRVRVWFDDVLVLGSASLPEALTDGVQPWPLDRLAPYRPEIIAGFRAEAYTVGLAGAWDAAQRKMEPTIRQQIRRDIGGDAQRIHSMRTATAEETFKHILLPLWIAAYRFRGRSFRFVVNGLTGQVAGERPWSPWKIGFAILAAALLAGALYVVSEMQPGGRFENGFDLGGATFAPSAKPRAPIPINGDIGGTFDPPGN